MTESKNSELSSSFRKMDTVWHADDLSAYTRQSRFRVISVHPEVINIEVESWPHLLMIAGPELFRGPASVGLSLPDFGEVRQSVKLNDPGKFSPRGIALPGKQRAFFIRFAGPGADFSPPPFLRYDPGELLSRISNHRGALRERTRAYLCSVLLGETGRDDVCRNSIVSLFPAVLNALLGGDQKGFIDACGDLVGLGYGSTPTGDDLIHGALIGLHYLNRVSSVYRPIPVLPHSFSRKTTQLGYHMLNMGIRGLTPEPVRNYVLDLFGGGDLEERFRNLGRMGADSGLSAAVGILVFLEEAVRRM